MRTEDPKTDTGAAGDDKPALQPASDPAETLGEPGKPPGAPLAPSPLPAQPLVAETALDGQITEREAALAKKLKDVESHAATLTDENQRLKATPGPGKNAAKAKKHWLSGGTFFEPDDDE